MRRLSIAFLLFAAGIASAEIAQAALRQKLIETAKKYAGVPYMYGSESPKAFDCSGFVRYVYREATGLELPRSSKGQWAEGKPLDLKDMLPGDVLVFDTVGGSPSHVAMYMGEQQMIHAVSDGPRTGVIVSKLSDSYFGPRTIGARAFLESDAVSPPPSGGGDKPGPKLPTDRALVPVIPAKPPAPVTVIPAKPPIPVTGAPAKPPASVPVIPAKPPIPVTGTPTKAEEEAPLAQIEVLIPPSKTTVTDRVPAATGTRIAFTLSNATGKAGKFTIIFYKNDIRFSKIVEIHKETVGIATGAFVELAPYLFTEPGQYKLIVKDNWNTQLVERIFVVVERPK